MVGTSSAALASIAVGTHPDRPGTLPCGEGAERRHACAFLVPQTVQRGSRGGMEKIPYTRSHGASSWIAKIVVWRGLWVRLPWRTKIFFFVVLCFLHAEYSLFIICLSK